MKTTYSTNASECADKPPNIREQIDDALKQLNVRILTVIGNQAYLQMALLGPDIQTEGRPVSDKEAWLASLLSRIEGLILLVDQLVRAQGATNSAMGIDSEA